MSGYVVYAYAGDMAVATFVNDLRELINMLYMFLQVGYVVDFGTVYISGYDRLPFHLNKCDEFGNTMLSLACQNGNMKLCKYLIGKGANPSHQNKNGQTPSHFAIAYKFFDLSTYLFENGGDDTLENKFGLSPYDGLSAEGGEGGDGGDN